MFVAFPFKKLENSSEWKPINSYWFLTITLEVAVSHRRLGCSLHMMDTFEQFVPEPPFLSLDFAWLWMQPCHFKGLLTVKADSLTTYQVNSVSELSSVLPSPPFPSLRHLDKGTCAKAASFWGVGEGCISTYVKPKVCNPFLCTA